jgi:glycosyltransferase involved in cell wall biosynthesis
VAPLKLLVATPSAERLGGAQSVLWAFLRHVDWRRIEPSVAFLAEGRFADDVVRLGVPTTILPTARLRRGGSAVRTIRALRRLLSAQRPDLVLAWGPKPQLYVGPACRLEGIQRRAVWRATELPQAAVHRLAMALPANAIVCATGFVARAHERLRPRRRIVVSHPGVDPTPRPRDDEVERLRSRNGIRRDASVVGTLGRLVPVKRHDRLLRLVAELRARGHDTQALIVGGDEQRFAPGHEADLKRLAGGLGLGDDAIFTGHTASPGAYLAAMDVFVSSAVDEGFGAAVVEALAAGVPVVAVDRGGPTEIVEHGRSGLLADAGSEESSVEAVTRVLTEPQLREELSRGGRARYESTFTGAAGAERLTNVLGELAEGVR